MKVRLNRGSVIVEWPDDELKRELSHFRHAKDGSGEYEELFSYSEARHSLVTLPGFADRVKLRCEGEYRIVDERVPMPSPDIVSAKSGLEPVWQRPLQTLLEAGGGVATFPLILSFPEIAAAIIRAYPRSGLLARGTPVIAVAVRDTRTVNQVSKDLRKMLPEREIGSTARSDSEDVLVVTYGDLGRIPRHFVGVVIGEIFSDFLEKPETADGLGGVRNAARFGIMQSGFGSFATVALSIEGLFGPFASEASYDDAVNAGIGAPITVCWIKCPRPLAPLVSANDATLDAIAHSENDEFVKIVEDIVSRVGESVGCVVYGHESIVHKLQVSKVSKKMKYFERNAVLDGLSSGSIMRAAVAKGFLEQPIHQGVFVAATSIGDITDFFPYRKIDREQGIKKSFVVDFLHEWDVNNGRPGRLNGLDSIRKSVYEKFGFSQIFVDGVEDLPFL